MSDMSRPGFLLPLARHGSLLAPALVLLGMLVLPAGARGQGDTRTAVVLPPDDREHLLEEMRGFLVYTTETLEAALDNDMARVQRLEEQMRPPLARARQLASDDPLPTPAMAGRGPAVGGGPGVGPGGGQPTRFERMRRNLPQTFRLLMLQMREDMAEIGRDAVSRNDPAHTLRQLHKVQTVCIACHDAYRLEPGVPDARR
ncbi:hypothetical protein [Rhodocista pekingensis]|uniref:Cytochrome c n=1 Tax=Rhodocista pekingensis TaxID=201185 RepID=A0ABW2L0R9_9PROT